MCGRVGPTREKKNSKFGIFARGSGVMMVTVTVTVTVTMRDGSDTGGVERPKLENGPSLNLHTVKKGACENGRGCSMV
jgi:hypothetical protein